MDIAELRALAVVQFPANPTAVAVLLTVWVDADPVASSALTAAGVSPALFRQALAPFLPPPPHSGDSELLRYCTARQPGGRLHGLGLLRCVLAQPHHPLTLVLTRLGLRAEALPPPASALGVLVGTGKLATAAIDTPALARFGQDLTALARNNAFAALAPRPQAMRGLLDILLRQRKGNPALTGPAGVGKTALVERLAHDMTHNPDHPLAGRTLHAINLGALVAGTQYRGEFEERLHRLLADILSRTRPIVFIDELHLLVGAGRAEGMAMDAANLLKPILARDEARVIGATTTEEYQRYIATDKALARRFQELRLVAPQGEELLEILHAQVPKLSAYHKVGLPVELLTPTVALTDRYWPQRQQPDKSLDLLDTALVAARQANQPELRLEDLHATLSRLTGLPLGRLSNADQERLLELRSALASQVIGQDQAIEQVVTTLLARRFFTKDNPRPLGVFLFVGDTGVGKTELARALATHFLGDSKRLARFDLGENAGSEASLHSLLGAPPGLIGSDHDGALIAALRQPGEKVLLFDEVEKAHPAVQRMLLGLLERGAITSAAGEPFDAKHCLIILTTNAVTGQNLGRLGSIGFTSTAVPDVRELLMASFSPEFLGRLDEIVLFRRLDRNDLRQILTLRLNETLAELQEDGITTQIDREDLATQLFTQLTDHRGGARDIQRLIERHLLATIVPICLGR